MKKGFSSFKPTGGNTEVFQDGNKVGSGQALNFIGATVTHDGHRANVTIDNPPAPNLQSVTDVGNTTTNSIGIGESTPDRLLHVKGNELYGVGTFERTTTAIAQVAGALRVKTTTSGDMADGFGSAIAFFAEDNAGVEQYAADIRAIRDGSDDDWGMSLGTVSDGMAYAQVDFFSNGYSKFYGNVEATSFITTGGTSADFVKGDGSLGTVDLSGYVPYTGATANVDLGANSLYATSIASALSDSTYIDLTTHSLNESGTRRVDWANSQLNSGSGSENVLSLDWANRTLNDTTGTAMLNWANPNSNGDILGGNGFYALNLNDAQFIDSYSVALDWNLHQLNATGATFGTTVDWQTQQLFHIDGSSVKTLSVDWASRTLNDTSGNICATWGNGYALSYDVSGFWGGVLGGSGGAGYFYDTTNNVYLGDGTYAINATGNSLLTGYTKTSSLSVNADLPTGYTFYVQGIDDQPSRGTELLTNPSFDGSVSPWVLGGNASWNAGGYVTVLTGFNGFAKQTVTTTQYSIYELTIVYTGTLGSVQLASSPTSQPFENGILLSTTFDGTYYTRKYYTQVTWAGDTIVYLGFNLNAKIYDISLKQIIDGTFTASFSKDGIGSTDVRGGDQYGNFGFGKLSGSSFSLNASKSIGIGDYTLQQGFQAINTIAIGYGVLQKVPNPNGTIAIGAEAGSLLPIGQANYLTIVGTQALSRASSAGNDTVFGYRAGYNHFRAGANTYFGYKVCGSATNAEFSGNANSVFGSNSAPFLSGDSQANSFFGAGIAYQLIEGSYNTAMGSSAMQFVTGSRNTCIGNSTGGQYENIIDDNLLIGYNAQVPATALWQPDIGRSGYWNIGNALFACNSVYTYGIRGGNFALGYDTQYFEIPYRWLVAEAPEVFGSTSYFAGMIANEFISYPVDEWNGTPAINRQAIFQLEANDLRTRLNLDSRMYDDVAFDGTIIQKEGEFNVYPLGGSQAINTKMPTERLHINGNMVTADESILGAEKVTNGTFTGSATGWTLGTGWSYSANTALKGADGTGTLSQNVSAVVGEYYLLEFTISGLALREGDISDKITPTLGGVTGDAVFYNGTYKQHFKATSTGNLIFSTNQTTSRCVIDSVSVKKIIGGDVIALGNVKANGITLGYVVKTGNYTLTNTDRTVECITNASTQTFPTAVGCTGREYRIINASNFNITVATTSGQTIGNKVTGNPTTVILAPEEWLDVISNNANWRAI